MTCMAKFIQLINDFTWCDNIGPIVPEGQLTYVCTSACHIVDLEGNELFLQLTLSHQQQ